MAYVKMAYSLKIIGHIVMYETILGIGSSLLTSTGYR